MDPSDDLPPGIGTTGLVVIRAWTEPGSSRPLRAQMRVTGDVTAGFQRTVTLADIELVCDAVRDWLTDLVAIAADRDAARLPSDGPLDRRP